MEQRIDRAEAPQWVLEELDRVCAVLEKDMKKFGNRFPSACAENGRYEVTENDDWTNGFWTGMLWMAYQYTGKDAFRQQACRNMESFERWCWITMISGSSTAFPWAQDTGSRGTVTGKRC